MLEYVLLIALVAMIVIGASTLMGRRSSVGLGNLSCAFAPSASGILDASFGTGGEVDTVIQPGPYLRSNAYAVTVLADGSVIAAGRAYGGYGPKGPPGAGADYWALARYTPAGALDTGQFGIPANNPPNTDKPPGTVAAIPGPLINNFTDPTLAIRGVALDGHNPQRIVVVGTTEVGANGVRDRRMVVMRFNLSGTVDTSFNASGGLPGTVVINSPNMTQAAAIAVQPNGKIVLAGFAITAEGFVVARLNDDGTADTGLGSTGVVTYSIAGAGNYWGEPGGGMALRPGALAADDEQIVMVGKTTAGLAVVRFKADGTLDPGFGTGGVVTSTSAIATAMALQSDGSILAAGAAGGDIVMLRYTTSGALDPTFGTGGKTVTSLSSGTDYANAMAIQADGAIVVAGSASNGTDSDFAVARFTATGTLDATFNRCAAVPGSVTLPHVGKDDAYGVALQDGRITVVGSFTPPGYGQVLSFHVARFTA